MAKRVWSSVMSRTRNRLILKKEEVGFVRSYLEKKLYTKDWPSHETQKEALADYEQRPIVGKFAHDELARWCRKWLNDAQCLQLRNTMNSWRHRQRTIDLPKRIHLSHDAWKMISTLAEMEKKSISSFIIDRFAAEYQALDGDGPLS